MRLRQSGERGALIAASLEPRVDLHTRAPQLLAVATAATIPMPRPDDTRRRWRLEFAGGAAGQCRTSALA